MSKIFSLDTRLYLFYLYLDAFLIPLYKVTGNENLIISAQNKINKYRQEIDEALANIKAKK